MFAECVLALISTGVYIGDTYGAARAGQCMDNFKCNGSETALTDCSFTTPLGNRPDPASDVAIRCIAGMILVACTHYRHGQDKTVLSCLVGVGGVN